MSDKTPYLGNPQKTIEVIQKYEFAFQKKFGQNFLIDTHVLDKIISAAEITKDDLVVEIGKEIKRSSRICTVISNRIGNGLSVSCTDTI